MESAGVSPALAVLPSIHGDGNSKNKFAWLPPSKAEIPHIPVQPPESNGDDVNISPAFALLSQLKQQLPQTPEDAVPQALSGAATQILAQAQSQADPEQAEVLEHVASRLLVAAHSRASGLPAESFSALFGE